MSGDETKISQNQSNLKHHHPNTSGSVSKWFENQQNQQGKSSAVAPTLAMISSHRVLNASSFCWISSSRTPPSISVWASSRIWFLLSSGCCNRTLRLCRHTEKNKYHDTQDNWDYLILKRWCQISVINNRAGRYGWKLYHDQSFSYRSITID